MNYTLKVRVVSGCTIVTVTNEDTGVTMELTEVTPTRDKVRQMIRTCKSAVGVE